MKKTLANLISGCNPFSKKEEDNKILYSIRILLSAYLIYFLGLIIGEAVIILGSMPFGYNATDRQLPQDVMLLCSFFGYAFVIFVVILYAVKIAKLSLKSIGMNENVKTILKGMLLGILSLAIILSVLLASGVISYDGRNRDVNWLQILLFFFAFLVQSAMEEVLCRGYLLHRLKEKTGLAAAIVMNLLFFSVFHFSKLFEEGFLLGVVGVSNLVLISLIFSLLTCYDKNIYSALGFHWIWNFALYNVVGMNLSGIEAEDALFRMSVINDFLAGKGYGIESSPVTTVVLGVILFLIVLRGKGREKNGVQQ